MNSKGLMKVSKGQLTKVRRHHLTWSKPRVHGGAPGAPRAPWVWKSLSRVWLFATPWSIQSMEFSRPEYWVGSHSLLQGIFPTQGSNLGLPHCRLILYQLNHQGSPQIVCKLSLYVHFLLGIAILFTKMGKSEMDILDNGFCKITLFYGWSSTYNGWRK